MTELGLIIRSHPRDEASCLVSGAVKNPFRLLQSLRSRVDVVGVVCADQTGRFTSHGYEVTGRSLGFLKLYVRTLLWNLVNLPAVFKLFRRRRRGAVPPPALRPWRGTAPTVLLPEHRLRGQGARDSGSRARGQPLHGAPRQQYSGRTRGCTGSTTESSSDAPTSA